MKWNPKDIEKYKGAKEYVDTVILPLNGITFEGGMIQSASMNEFISILTQEIENQFKGRVLLLPQLTYCSDWESGLLRDTILRWHETLTRQEFKHVFYITADEEWKKEDGIPENSLIWTASLPLEHMEDKYKKPLIEEQVQEIMQKIIRLWRRG